MTMPHNLVTGGGQCSSRWQEASFNTHCDGYKTVLCVSWSDRKVPSYGDEDDV